MQDIKQTIEKLKKLLIQWEHEYYVLNNPTVSDAEYDLTLKELINLENQYPQYSTNDSPTKRVGEKPIDKFEKFVHRSPMLSLSNAFNKNDILKFDNDIKKVLKNTEFTYCVEPKIDGLSLTLIYEKNKLLKASTRGDGIIGEDVTINAKTIKSIPLSLNNASDIEVRGEVFLYFDQFNKINQNIESEESKFSNCRNAASGSMHNLDPKIVAKRKLSMFSYLIIDPEKQNLKTQIEIIEFLKKNNFQTCEEIKECFNIEEVWQHITYLTNNRSTLKYPIDGVVVKLNEINLYHKVGSTSKFPKWAIAYKFPATIVETKLLKINATIGRTGRVTYVAQLNPVELDGSVVASATLHNAEYILAKDIRENDTVKIFKAGEIIPKVIEPVLEKRTNNCIEFKPISYCPICNTKLEKFEDEVDQYCINVNCKARIMSSLIHFTSRNAMNIDGLSEKIITKLYNEGFISKINDIYLIEAKKDEIIKSDLRLKDKSINNIINAINLSKNQPFDKLIFGLGIRHVGEVIAKKLSRHFKNIDNLKNATFDELKEIEDIGDAVAISIIDFFKNEENIELIQKLINLGLKTEHEKSTKIDVDSVYYQKRFVITGSFEINRNLIKKKLEDLYDAKVSNTVTKDTDYLIASDENSTKYKEAMKLNIKIITKRIW